MVVEHNGGSRVGVTLALVVASLVVSACGLWPNGGSTPTPPGAHFTASPPPTIAAGFTRFSGKVTEAGTNKALEGVCVVIATGGTCQEASPRTDTAGFWWIDLPTGVDWDFSWTKDGYDKLTKRLHSDPGQVTIGVVLNPLK